MNFNVLAAMGLLLAGMTHALSKENRSEVVKSGKSQASLLAPGSFAPGQDFTVALVLDPESGWHNYWVNPGDSGMVTTVEWTLPEGLSAGPLQFPVPHRFESSGLVSFGYSEPVYLLTKIHVPAEFSAAEVKIKALVSWLSCNDDGCVPGDAELHVNVKAGEEIGADDVLSGADSMIYPSDQSVELKHSVISEAGDQLLLTAEPSVDLRAILAGELVAIFESGSLVDHGEAVNIQLEDGELSIRAKKGDYFSGLPAEVVVVVIPQERTNAVRLVFSKK